MSTPLGSLREKYSYSPLWLLVPVIVTVSLLMAALSMELLSAPSSGPSPASLDAGEPAATIDVPHA